MAVQVIVARAVALHNARELLAGHLHVEPRLGAGGNALLLGFRLKHPALDRCRRASSAAHFCLHMRRSPMPWCHL